MPGIREGLEEIVFCGVKFAFDLKSRFRLIARVNDEYVDTFGPLPVTDAVRFIDEFVKPYIGNEVGSVDRITTEQGYVLVLALVRGAKTTRVTFELIRA